MELTQRQKLTIEHLNYKEKKTPQQIISWCYLKMSQPKVHHPRTPGCRKFSIKYYQQIADYMGTLAKAPPSRRKEKSVYKENSLGG